MDWKINLKDSVAPFLYCEGDAGEIGDVAGSAHEGMLCGAREILNQYGVRRMVHRLLAEGFVVKAVGHSLGDCNISLY